MNVTQLKYALEIAQTGSFTAAAQNLFLSQPNLSKAIKELEEEIGIVIFQRSTKGANPTREGNEFLTNAKVICRQIAEFEAMYESETKEDTYLTFCGPRATYISLAFTDFLNSLSDRRRISINIKEQSTSSTINNVAAGEAQLGVVRCRDIHEEYVLSSLMDRGLRSERLLEFEPVLVMSAKHPLADREDITEEELSEYIELIHGDMEEEKGTKDRGTLMREPGKRIYLYERGTQGDILANVHTTYMWMSRMPESVRQAAGLVVKKCSAKRVVNRDILIYRSGHIFTKDEKTLIDCINKRIDEISR